MPQRLKQPSPLMPLTHQQKVEKKPQKLRPQKLRHSPHRLCLLNQLQHPLPRLKNPALSMV